MKRLGTFAVALLVALAFAPSARTQNITTFAGGGNTFSGAAASLPVGVPYKVSQKDSAGNYYIASLGTDRIVKVNAAGEMSLLAGNGTPGYSGDGGPAVEASLALGAGGSTTIGIALDSAGNVYFADGGNEVVRVVNTQTSSAIKINGVTIQPGNIQTVAGHPCTGSCPYGDGGPATSAVFDSPSGVAVDAAGNIYIMDSGDEEVRVVNTQSSSITIFNVTIAAGDIETIAGNVETCTPFSANGAQARTVCVGSSNGLAFDSSQNLYIAAESARILEVIRTSGAMDSVAGTGSAGYTGDGAAATSAKIGGFPGDLAFDSAGNLFIADTANNRIRVVNTQSSSITIAGVTIPAGDIATVAGNGTSGYSGDGGAATSAELNNPRGVAVDSSDNIFIADLENYRIREVTKSTGIISTVVGNGWIDYDGDGVPATNTDLFQPSAVAVDGSGNVFISDGNNAIRMVAAGATPTITTVAGNGAYGYSGNGGAGTIASICFPGGVAGGPSNSVFFSDIYNEVVREVTGGIINVFAGSNPGLPCWAEPFGPFSGSPVTPPTNAYFNYPDGVAVDSAGDVFIADSGHNAVVEVKAGTLSVVAGNGTAGFSGDDGAATLAMLNAPSGVALDGHGNLFIADTDNHRIRKVDTSGIITTVAGNGNAGYNGEGAATGAYLNFPEGVAVDSLGDVFIADTYNNRIREVTTAGIISTVAGDGSYGYNGDGIPATTAWLANPTGVAVDSLGNLYIADLGNSRIREVPALQATSTSVESSLNPSTYGQTVTFTATVTAVAPGSGTPTGTVTFLDGGSAIGSGTLSDEGVATLDTSTLAVGSHTITTSYGGGANYTGSTGSLTGNPQKVSQAQSTTTFTSTPPAQLAYNGTYTPTASTTGDGTLTIGASGACAISGGVVTINAGSGICTVTATTAAGNNYLGSSATPQMITATNATATVMLSNMTQTYTGSPLSPTATTNPTGLTVNFTYNGSSTAPTAAGSYSLVATIAPGGNYTGSASGTFTISKAQSTTTFTSTAPAQLPYNGTYTPTASTTGDGTLTIGASGACAISAGVVTINAGSGICTVTATTAAGNNYLGSSATSQAITAIKAAATVTIGTITPEPSVAGVSYTVNVSVSPQSGGTPTGTVTVSDGTGASCPITLSGGAGGCALISTLAGSLTITATYGGDPNFTGSSGTKPHMVVAGTVVKLVLSPPNAVITAGQAKTYSAAGFDNWNNPTGDVTTSTTFALTPNGSCTGASCTATVADLNGSSHTVTGTYTGGATGQTTLTVNAGTFTQLQLVVPGETATPGAVNGFTGTPNTEYVNGAFNVTVNAVDQYWNLANTVTDTVAITSTDTHASMPSSAALVAGTGTFSVTLETVSYNPAITTLTATDATNGSMTASTSPLIPVIVVYTAGISPADAATGQATSYTLTISNAAAPNTNNLGSLTVAIPASGGTPTNISVTATQPGSAPATWGYDTTTSTPTMMNFRRCTASGGLPFDGCSNEASNAVQPGGTIVIQFTTTSSAAVPEVWNTTAYSDAAYTSALPLAGSQPTVNFGVAPAITSANSTTFTYNTAGTFTVTTTGALPLSLSENGALPGTVTFTDNGNGTATLAGTPNASGPFQVTITAQNGYGSDATQIFTLNVSKAPATVMLSNLTQTYTGSALSPTASTTPSNLGITWTNAPQTNAGTYTVTAAVNDPNYQGSASGSFIIKQASQTITVTTSAPAAASYGATFGVAATASSGLAVAITTAGVCSGSGSGSAAVSMTSGTGSCTVNFNQGGNTNYSAASQVSSSTAATKIASTVKITSNTPNPSATGQAVVVSFTVTGAGSPSGTVTVAASTGETPCKGTLSSGAGSCSLTFLTVGSRTLTATYSGDNNFVGSTSAGVSQSVNGSQAGVSPSSINFGTVYLASINVKSVTLTNQGNAPMTISNPFFSIVSGGNSNEFAAINLCPGSLAAGKSCTIEVSFIAGPYYNPQTATLSIMDSASNSPQTVALAALVINPQAGLSATSLSLGTEKVGSASAAKAVTLKNTGATLLTLSSIAITGADPGDFKQTNTCLPSPGSLSAGASCTITVTFTPTAKGSRSASVVITDNAQNSPQKISLSGTGD